ncbi:hypothetical protein [Caenimonas koreensis]|uniref:Transmembrane protein n=1 Tax=Caenimonas koreensis DSM 17982 TaxID=1121255 RepID=A0A844B4Q2_9BURK|nr:hypothetical protein [Caenimonas koreensis]MRD49778.1 hypothetical protein [Caenimonas koreensis DSM 17982]
MSYLRRLLRQFILGTLALVLIFEEWGWEQLSALIARLGRLPVFAWLERQIKALPPWGALAVFFVPALALLPVKLLALFLIGRSHPMLGLIVLLAAKVAGTAILARLFTLTQPALMRLAWFARWYPRWKSWKDSLIAQVKASQFWLAGARLKARVLQAWRERVKRFKAED